MTRGGDERNLNYSIYLAKKVTSWWCIKLQLWHCICWNALRIQSAEAAMDALDDTVLMGRDLNVKLAHNQGTSDKKENDLIVEIPAPAALLARAIRLDQRKRRKEFLILLQNCSWLVTTTAKKSISTSASSHPLYATAGKMLGTSTSTKILRLWMFVTTTCLWSLPYLSRHVNGCSDEATGALRERLAPKASTWSNIWRKRSSCVKRCTVAPLTRISL